MGNGRGLSRGDRNRNARLARLRELVPLSNAIVGIDLDRRDLPHFRRRQHDRDLLDS